MKKICFLFVLSGLFSFQLQAQFRDSENILQRLIWDDTMLNIFIDTRIDLQAGFMDGKYDELGFDGKTIKLLFTGEVVPGIRYRIRHNLNKSQAAFPREGYSGAIDHAWLQFDAGTHWTFTVGKQSVQIGTFENDYNPADVYLASMVYMDFDGYKTGVNAAYKFNKQIINLQVVNSDTPQFASEEYKNKALAFNAMWQGDLFNELIRTRWGYGIFQHSNKRFYNWLTLGTQLNIEKFTTEIDYYLGNRNIDYGAIVYNTDLGYRYVEDQSVSLNLKYNFGKWRPFVKGTWNKRHDKRFDMTAYESWGIQAVAEFYPFTNKYTKDLRFHAAYMYSNTDFKGSFSQLDNSDTHTILVGTRWLFKAK
ncbi:MAG: OprO/OprP family phosphate-selective porin [Candidatus Azobacteroides sp.]|nr:OprO/OprP family phosphate-selective porin [Candidatus Azobacteroides sp.]